MGPGSVEPGSADVTAARWRTIPHDAIRTAQAGLLGDMTPSPTSSTGALRDEPHQLMKHHDHPQERPHD